MSGRENDADIDSDVEATRHQPRIRVIALGGTIAMTPDAAGGAVPTLTAADLVAAVPGLADVGEVTADTFRAVPGAHLRLADLVALAGEIDRATGDAGGAVDGVVVTQGTDTLEETAFALDLLCASDAPIVVTGAMRTPAQPGADGPANLLASCRTAASPRARGCGVLVVLDDTIHAARFVGKRHTSRPSAFASEPAGPVGWVAEDRVRLPLRPRARVHLDVPADATLPRVALVTAALGDDLDHLDVLDVDGVVVEAFGAGHLPAAVVDRVSALAERVPVVLASRTGAGETYRHTYGFDGSERDLLARGLVPAGALDGPKARLLLALTLASSGDVKDLVATIETLAG